MRILDRRAAARSLTQKGCCAALVHDKTDMRAAMNVLRTGCPGATCPTTAFSSTVYNIAIWAELHMALRERMGRREASPSAAVLDSQIGQIGGKPDGQSALPLPYW
jgi:hypothetical protein